MKKLNRGKSIFKSGWLCDIRSHYGDFEAFPALNCSVAQAKSYFAEFPPKTIPKVTEEIRENVSRTGDEKPYDLPVGTMLVKTGFGYYRPARIKLGEDRIDGVLLEPFSRFSDVVKLRICKKGVLTPYKIAEANGLVDYRHGNRDGVLRTFKLAHVLANDVDTWADLLTKSGFLLNWAYYSFAEMMKDFSRKYPLNEYYQPA